MKVALIPEGGVLITNLIFKNGHTPLQMYDMSPEKARQKDPYDDELIDQDSPLYNLRQAGTKGKQVRIKRCAIGNKGKAYTCRPYY